MTPPMKQLSLIELPSSPTHNGIHNGGQRHVESGNRVEKETAPYFHLHGDIPLDLEHDALISLTRPAPPRIHSLGFQPAISFPEFPRWFLRKYATPTFSILEPFAGSGTTIIESLRHEIPVYWLDYHPLSRLICRVKTSEFSGYEVCQEAAKILRQAAAQSATQTEIPTTIYFANKDFWFQKPVQEGLEILRGLITRTGPDIQPILWLAFAASVRKTSDMNDGMILAAKRSHIQEIPKRSRTDVFKTFREYVDKAVEAMEEWGRMVNGVRNLARELPLQDARTLDGCSEVDAIVTSPPYINAIDYVWASKFELHWLGLVTSDQERLQLYEREIGTERLSKGETHQLGQTGMYHLDGLIREIYTGEKYKASKGQNVLRARVVYQYFVDMKQHFASSFKILKPSGYYCFTIGDSSRICGVDIPVAKLLTEFACETGFDKVFQFHLLLKNRKLNIPRNVDWAGVIKHDTTVVLRKPV